MANRPASPEAIEFFPGELSDTLFFRGAPVLSYHITYPRLSHRRSEWRYIGGYYQKQAQQLKARCQSKYYPEAVKQYSALAPQGGFMPLELSSTYHVMYNGGGLVSLCHDLCLNLGALGRENSRSAQTWSCPHAFLMPLSAFFRSGFNWQRPILASLREQIARAAGQDDGSYFSDWPVRLGRRLDFNQYYLTDEGFALYFGEEEIAPCNTGLPTFLIPYGEFGQGLSRPL